MRPRTLAAAGLLLALVAGACGGGPRPVALADLAGEPEAYVGDAVTATGVVIEFDADQGSLVHHFVLQDTDANRVKILPPDAAAPYVGRLVRATGTFRFADDTGRILEVERLEPAG